MNRYKVAFFVTALLLAGSLVLHIAAARDRAGAGGPTSTDGSEAPASCETELRDLTRCRQQLAGCKTKSWEIVQQAIRQGAEQQAEVEKTKPGTQEQEGPAQDWRQALCEASEDFLRQVWEGHKEQVHAMLQGAGTEEWIDLWMDVKMADIDSRWDLERHERNQLQDGYRRLWGDHAATMQSLMQQTPPDYTAIAEATREFFKDEEQLIGELFGEDARAEYTAAELKNRTLVLAMFATFADRPWDDQSVGW